MRCVFAPVDERNASRSELEIARELVHVHHAITSIDLRYRSDNRDHIASNRLDVLSFVDGKTIGELHQHLRTSRFWRVNRSREPVDRLCFANESFLFRSAQTAWIS